VFNNKYNQVEMSWSLRGSFYCMFDMFY